MLRKILRALSGSRPVETSSELWNVAAAHDEENNPIVVRCRSATPEGVRVHEYPHLMIVAWEYDSETGMPGPAEKERMNRLEHGVVDAVEPTKQAFLMAVVTGKGACEWRFYAKDNAEFMALMNRALAGHAKYPIEVRHQSDPRWLEYRRFVPPDGEGSPAKGPPEPAFAAVTMKREAVNEMLERARELKQRGLHAEAAELLLPLSRASVLSVRLQALVDLVTTQTALKEHREVLRSVDRLDESLAELRNRRGPEALQEERAQNILQEILLTRHAQAAAAYEGLGNLDDAIHQARLAIGVARERRKPGDGERVAHREYSLAAILRNAGRVEEALAALDAGLAECSSHIPSLILKAMCLELLGSKDEGEALFAAIHPDDEAGKAYLTMNAPAYHAVRGEKDRMLQLFEEATYYWGGPQVVAYALEDKDFVPYREDPDFRACLERCRPLERRAGRERQ